jgi:hypothetical protein
MNTQPNQSLIFKYQYNICADIIIPLAFNFQEAL